MPAADAPLTSCPRPLAARPTIAGFTLLWMAVLGASYLSSDWTRNDFERFDNLWLSSLFFVLFLALALLYTAVAAYGVALSRRAVALSTAAWLVLLLATFPIGSKDVFAYAFAGKIWHTYGANPYLVPAADFPQDSWQAYVQVWWREAPSVYGPLFLWQAWVVDALAGGALWAAVALHKLIAALSLAAALLIAARLIAPTPGPAPPALVLLAWNPLLLFETAGCAHNDVAMLLLIVAAVACARRARWPAAVGLLALSAWYKWYSVLFGPPLLIAIRQRAGTRAALRQALVGAAAALVIGVLGLLPLPGSLPSIADRLMHPGALTDVFPTELSPPLALLRWALGALGVDPSGTGPWFHRLRGAAFALAYGAALAWQWRARRDDTLVASCALVALAFTLLLLTILYPWHLACAVGLGLLSTQPWLEATAVLVTVLGLLSYFLTFALAALALGLAAAALLVLRWRRSRFGSTGTT